MDDDNNGREKSENNNHYSNDQMSVSSTDRPLLTYQERVARARQFQEEEQRKKLDELQKSLKRIEEARVKVNLDRQKKIDEIKRRDDEHRKKVNERRLEKEKINLEKINRIIERSQERNAKKSSNLMLASCYVPGSQANKVNATREAGNRYNRGFITVGRDERLNVIKNARQEAFEERIKSYMQSRHRGCFLTHDSPYRFYEEQKRRRENEKNKRVGSWTHSSQSLTRLNSRQNSQKNSEKTVTENIPRASSALSFAQPTQAFLNRINNNSVTKSPNVSEKRSSLDGNIKKLPQAPIKLPLPIKKKQPAKQVIEKKQSSSLSADPIPRRGNSSLKGIKNSINEDHTDTINDVDSMATVEESSKIGQSSASEIKSNESFEKPMDQQHNDSSNSDDYSLNHKSHNASENGIDPRDDDLASRSEYSIDEKNQSSLNNENNNSIEIKPDQRESPEIPLRNKRNTSIALENSQSTKMNNNNITPNRKQSDAKGSRTPIDPKQISASPLIFSERKDSIMTSSGITMFQTEITGSGEGNDLSEEAKQIYQAKMAEMRRIAKEKKAEQERLLLEKKEEEQRKMDEFRRQRTKERAEAEARAKALQEEKDLREREENERLEREQEQLEKERREREEEAERLKKESEERERREKEERELKEKEERRKKLANIMTRVKSIKTPTSHRDSLVSQNGDADSSATPLENGSHRSSIDQENVFNEINSENCPFNGESILEKENNLSSNNNNYSVMEKSTKTTFQHPLLKAMQNKGRLNSKTAVDLMKKNLDSTTKQPNDSPEEEKQNVQPTS